jgi:hypothetical protein
VAARSKVSRLRGGIVAVSALGFTGGEARLLPLLLLAAVALLGWFFGQEPIVDYIKILSVLVLLAGFALDLLAS